MKEAFLSSSWHRVAKLKPRIRGHVQVRRHHYRGQPWYIIRNEVSGRLYRFTPAVYLFIGLMDGARSVNELWSIVVTRLGDDAPGQDQIIRLLSQLHSADLLQSGMSPDAGELLERHASYSNTKVRQSFGSLLSVKIPVLDPDRFLERTAPAVRPFFGVLGLVLWLAVVLPALILAAIHWPDLTGDVMDQVMAAQNLLMAAVVFAVLKTLHELGHGYATKVLGGTVHEIGIMMLIFAPVPYVDASASAAFPNKWQRILVGASGMLVELFLASLALYLWLLAEPGVIRSVCYSVMLVAGISTVIFNVNPLLRFDGYYMLCDLIESPNLGGRASRYWGWLVDRRVFGADVERPNATLGEQAWFIAYAPLAFGYRSLVILGTALFLAGHYYIVGVAIALWAIIYGLVWPAFKGLSHVLIDPRLERKRMRAAGLTFGGGAAISACLLTIPVPFHTAAEGIIWLPETNIVRSTADGFVKALAVRSGFYVEPGTLLVRAEEPDVASQLRILRSQVDAAQVRLASEKFNDRVQARITQQELAVFEANLADTEVKAAELLVHSRAAGVFVVPKADDLPGRFLRRGDVIGYVEDPNARLVRVVITQSNIDLVRTSLMGIEVKLPQHPGESWRARILREVPAGSEELPSKALTHEGGGLFSADLRYPDRVRSIERTFQFDLELPQGATPGYFGSRVYVRFAHEAEPLAVQWYRRLRQLFLARFDA